MWRQQRLRKRREFEEVRNRGLSRMHPLLVLQAAANDLGITRFGFTVGRRAVPTAVGRNRVRRRIREAVRLLSVEAGWDVVLIARRDAKTASFLQLREAAQGLFRRAGLERCDERSPGGKR